MVALSGAGAGTTGTPALTISAASLSFGDVSVGTPIVLALTLTSTGTSPVTVSGVKLTGAGFTDSGLTLPVTLNPNVAVKLQVQFDPTAAGTSTGSLTVASNSSTGGSTVVALSGIGTTASTHKVTLNWVAPTNSAAPVTGYNVYRSPSGATTFQRVNPSSFAQTTYVDQSVLAGASYNYYIMSTDASGTESTASNQVTVTVP
jgi:hypothetical protein